MTAYSDYIIYVDESGDHNLEKIDPDYPIFVLAFCVFRKNDYVNKVVPALQDFKFRWFGHDAVVLHEHEIRKQEAPFNFLRTKRLHTQFMEDLNELVASLPMTIIAAVIDKRKLTASGVEDALNPYPLALLACMGLTHEFLSAEWQTTLKTYCLFEKRGASEDKDLELAFRRLNEGAPESAFMQEGYNCFEIAIVDKRTNSSGLQMADLTARPIGLSILRPDQPNRAFDIVRNKLWRVDNGATTGGGLIVLP
jgi:hypothetical protein